MTENPPSTILFVDDDASNRRLLGLLFREAGYRLLEAGSGGEALDLDRAQRPDLVILDVNLPDVTGFEVCQRLRADPATRSLSILHLSAVFVGSDDRTHGLEGGADAYLTKPVEPRELLATVRALLRIRAAERARRAAHQWRITFDAISDPLCLLDADDRVLRCNRALADALGLPFGKVVRRPLAEAARENLADDEALALTAAVREAGREGREVTLAGRCFRVTCDPIHDALDALDAGKVVILADVTQARHLEEQLRQSQRLEAVGRLAGGIAQDFNNLLTAILGNASLLLRDLPPADPDRNLVSTIERAAWRAADLTRQLLGFSRQALLWLQRVDPGGLLDDVAAAVAGRVGVAGVTLTLDKGADLWPVRADPAQLAQVLTNLCINALEAMPQGGRLALRVRNETLTGAQVEQDLEARPGEFVRFAVEDSGAGIPAEMLDKIFDPFFTTKPMGRASGLGLAMVHGVVKQHQGWIRCHSEAGRGTRFEIYLPRAVAGEGEAAAEPHVVLLADESDVLRALAAAYIRQAGYEVLTAADGREAVEVFRREHGRIELVILDALSPPLTAREVLQQMRGVKPAVRALLAGDPLEADEAGEAAGFVARPYREGDLLEAVRRTLR